MTPETPAAPVEKEVTVTSSFSAGQIREGRQEAEGPTTRAASPLLGLDEKGFWGVFSLSCALASPPLAWPAALAGVGLLALVWYRAGQARSPEAADDVGFTRFFVGASLVVYAVSAYTGWAVGLWVMMLCGMFLLHCTRNLMVVERVLRRLPPPEPQPPAREPQEMLEQVSCRLAEIACRQAAAGRADASTDRAVGRLRALAKRYFLLRQRGALFLSEKGPPSPQTLEADLARARAALAAETDAMRHKVRELEVTSLQRILEASRRPEDAVRAFRGTLLAVEDAIDSLDAELDDEVESLELPEGLDAELAVLEATLAQAESDLGQLLDAPLDDPTTRTEPE
ncbi:MAG: hypothetical protein HY814_06135 [Candidatus Riflebacteria bacterium]|nr:hypothetical protein [Candidatus Riflebacteria bacterium]